MAKIKKPDASEELAMQMVQRVYGLSITSMKRMVSYDDQNFHIKVADTHHNPHIERVSPSGYTLKITNTEKSAVPDHFGSLHRVMRHLRKKGLRVPDPVPNIEGSTWSLEKVPLLNEGCEGLCGIHVLTFQEGEPVSQKPPTVSLLFQWGELLASVHDALQDFSCPHLERKDVFWSLEHVPEIRSLMGVLSPGQRELVSSVLDQFGETVGNGLPLLRKGFLHGDFNENNVLVEGEVVDGILDFEDVHRGAYVWDVGVMLAYVLLVCKNDPLDGAGHALAGYANRRALDTTEMAHLKMCIMCRLCQSLVLGAYSYSLDPTNTYLMSSAQSGWDRLSLIQSVPEADLLKRWEKIHKDYLTHANSVHSG